MSKILVTGGAGFIGSNLVDCLIENNHDVIVIDNLSTGKKSNINEKAQFIWLDLTCEQEGYKLFNAMKEVDYVFHCAALARVQPSIENPIMYNNHNINGTLNLLLYAKEHKVKRFIYSASSAAYGRNISPLKEDMLPDPMSPYGLQKLVGEYYCKIFSLCYGMETVSLRYFNVYGPRQTMSGAYASVVGIFLNQLKNNIDLTIVPPGTQRRDYTYVGDVVQANMLAMTSKNVGAGEVINIGSGENYSVQEIANVISDKQTFIEARIEPEETLADNSLAYDLLGWRSTQNVLEWIKNCKKEF